MGRTVFLRRKECFSSVVRAIIKKKCLYECVDGDDFEILLKESVTVKICETFFGQQQ